MLEIIALIYFSKKIGVLAGSKGLKPAAWKVLFIAGWICLELAGLSVGLLLFGNNNFISVVLLAYMFAITSYVIVKARLTRLQDAVFEEDGPDENA